ncbi:MAG TPA: type II toxin-antitoxin system VapC family toxin [Terriglobales bacterium]|nr:type II toxin-antitoxin system VapC family toxin [Terriglobales bacterium]
MNAVLVDSDILIEVARGRDQDLLGRWQGLVLSEAIAAVSPVSVAELWHGARTGEHSGLRDLFVATICLSIDAAIAERAGDFLRTFHKSHGLELGDALIGAAAAVYELPLWTRNRRHYPMPDLAFFG